MKTLFDCKDEIHSCSKCGLCQSVCPIYKITKNDCTVSRGHFIMLRRFINGELKMSKTINKYLEMCLKCSACSKFCPSGIDVVEVIALAKAEYFKLHKNEKLKSAILKILLNIIRTVHKIVPAHKSKKFDKKVLYFAGCGGTDSNVIKIMNSMNIEVISPVFNCCGFPFYIEGDLDSFKEYQDEFYRIIEQYENYDIVTNCATCQETLKLYTKWGGKELNIKNVFDYIKDNNLTLELKKQRKVTFHKPCNLNNMENVEWVLKNTKNLEYVEMEDYDKCCGGVNTDILNFEKRKILSKLNKEKRNSIRKTGVKTVLTSCLACKLTLNLFSWGKYNTQDFVKFLAKNVK